MKQDFTSEASHEAEEQEVKYRECDDMLARRFVNNMPAALRKKKNEDNFRRFITPTGNPMAYVRQHARSQSMSAIVQEKAEKDQERDERNNRYEEMQQLKEKLKEEELTWTSKLDNWKERRRSATYDVRRRKEDRESVAQRSSTSSWRKPKTYREIVEDKKRREAGSSSFDYDDDDDPFNSVGNAEETKFTKSKKMPYRGAVSVPDFSLLNINRNRQANDSKAVVQPPRNTSNVNSTVNHATSPSDSSTTDSSEVETSPRFTTEDSKSKNTTPSSLTNVWPPPPPEIMSSKTKDFPQKISDNITAPRANSTFTKVTRSRSKSPPPSSYPSRPAVVMRQKAPGSNNKERPKSAYSALSDRASTLPRNYHSLSTPKPFDANTSSFVQFRKSNFANKRNMWERIADHAGEPKRSAPPQHLASLLQQDTDRLQGNDNPTSSFSAKSNVSVDASCNLLSSKQTALDSIVKKDADVQPWQKSATPVTDTEHKPKIMGSSTFAGSRPWIRDFTPNQSDSKPLYKRVAAPVARASWSKSATLPARSRPLYTEEKIDTSKPQVEERLPLSNGTKTAESNTTQKSPRSPSSGVDSLFDDMKICINQRPKSEKGFGFTVRGGDDGRPVIVNTVSPGGAADLCQLCVGDEILAINDVRLESSLTQDGIVQLIVDSVITGNLSLNIRRYGKFKKTTITPRLSGTKVLMASGGFVQIRSDKGKAPELSTMHFKGNTTNDFKKREDSPVIDDSAYDLPLPPPPEDLEPPKKLSAVDRLAPKQVSPTAYRTTSPLSNLVAAAKSTTPLSQGRENKLGNSPTSNAALTYSPNNYEDDLQLEVMKAQHDLQVEERYLDEEKRHREENVNLRKKLLEEQRLLEEREAKREEEKKRRIEEAKAEEKKVEEELRRIRAAQIEQQRKREEEKRRLIEGRSFNPSYNQGKLNHWLIEEAERSRLAEEDGRQRMNAFNYSRENNTDPELADNVIPRLSERIQLQHGNPHIPGSLTDYWNDPSTPATLL